MKKRIALAHAIKESDLEFIDLIGGIPNPSLGFIPSDQSFLKYGACVLLIDPGKTDFKHNYASSIDLYSSVFPDVSFELNHVFWEDLSDRIENALNANKVNIGQKYQTKSAIYPELLKGAISARDLLVKNPAVKLLYLHENKIHHPCKPAEISKVKNTTLLSDLSIEQISKNQVLRLPDDDANKALSKYLLADIQSKLNKLSVAVENRVIARSNKIELRKLNAYIENSMYFDDGLPMLYVNYFDKTKRELINLFKDDILIDESKYEAELNEFFARHVRRGAFEEWVSKTIEPGFGKAFFYKTADYNINDDKEDISHDQIHGLIRETATLNNLSQEMNRNLVTCPNLLSTSAIKLAASVKERFHSIEDVEKNIQLLKSEDEVNDHFEILTNELNALIDDLAPYYKFRDPFGNLSSMYHSFAIEALVQSRCESNKILNESFFTDQFPLELNTRINDLKSSLIVSPYTYFELKMSTHLRLSDFSVAIVPKCSPPSLLRIVQKHGLRICGYEQGNNSDFVRVLNQQHNLLFGDGGEILTKNSDLQIENAL